MEAETLALIGAVGAARAQGAEVDLPNLGEVREAFHEWIMEDADRTEDESDHDTMMRALGLGSARG